MADVVDVISALAKSLVAAKRVVILTGAGISAESGVPTFRQAQTGLWRRYSPEDLATPGAFQRDPALVWGWYQWRRRLILRAKPNAGHRAIARLATLLENVTLITQNVDHLHGLAGSANHLALHGNIFDNRCPMDGTTKACVEFESALPPPCDRCGTPVRPNVVWFGENLDEGVLRRAFSAASESNLFLSIGTSALVSPAADLPSVAHEAGADIAEINPAETPVSHLCRWRIRETAARFLPRMVDGVSQHLVELRSNEPGS